jgi:NAD(P) transhydrogenase
VLATGSRPRTPEHVPVDHEHVLDSDSILSLIYLPRSLTVLGARRHRLRVRVDLRGARRARDDGRRGARPLAFLDPELTARFVEAFERWADASSPAEASSGALGRPRRRHAVDGRRLRPREKCLCALGRVANVAGLDVDAAGIALTARGHVQVDANLRTSAPAHLRRRRRRRSARARRDRDRPGRRAVRHALGPAAARRRRVRAGRHLHDPRDRERRPDEEQAVAKYGAPLVGRARFEELARAHINGQTDGLLKLVAAPDGASSARTSIGEAATSSCTSRRWRWSAA